MSQKLYGSLEDLQRTATFVVRSGETIWRTRKKKKTHKGDEEGGGGIGLDNISYYI